MHGLRVSLGVALSVGCHVAAIAVLSRPTPPRAPAVKPATIELTALPPPEPPKPEPPKPAPPKPEPSEPTRPLERRPAKLPPPDVAPPPAAISPTPVVLAGLSLSNEGIAVASQPSAPTPPAPRAVTAVSVAAPVPVKAPAPELTPVSDLSKRPVPPALDSALAQFYPSSLRNQGVEGEALVRVVLSKDGKVAQTTAVSESHPGFAPACERALRTSRWEPPIDKQGNPTMTALKYRCRFRVNL